MLNKHYMPPHSASRGRRILLVGHLGHGTLGTDGQTVRTRSVLAELVRALKRTRVAVLDTQSASYAFPAFIVRFWCSALLSDLLIALPGERAIRWLLPQYVLWKRWTRRQVHLIAIGGWLPRLAAQVPSLRRHLGDCDVVYVQTRHIAEQLGRLGLNNVVVFPNFRRFDCVREPNSASSGPLRCVFISRLTPAKGLEIAIRAAVTANAATPHCCTLDIYGPCSSRDTAWLASLRPMFAGDVHYHGTLAPALVSSTLANYDVLLFPTTYSGEGFPGVVLEAMIAGLAVLASDWHSNSELVKHGVNGFILTPNDVDGFADAITSLGADRSLLLALQRQSAAQAQRYHPDSVMPILLSRLGDATVRRCGD
jgi:glycosyltransferase involved in cell wall biosynthesis